MKNKFLKYFIFFIVLSCNKKQETRMDYYSNGKISDIEYYDIEGTIVKRKTFSKKGELVSIIEYKNGEIKKSKIYDGRRLISEYFVEKNKNCLQKIYYDNVTIYGKGKIDNKGRQIGWWSFFDESNLLKEKQEFKIIDNQQYFNQGIIYKHNGEIDSVHSHYIKFDLKKINKRSYIALLNYNPKINKDSEIAICVGNDIKSDFSNIGEVNLDTIVFKKKKIKEFPIVFEQSGEKKIRGFVLERYPKNRKDTIKKLPILFLESKTYFEKIIMVE